MTSRLNAQHRFALLRGAQLLFHIGQVALGAITGILATALLGIRQHPAVGGAQACVLVIDVLQFLVQGRCPVFDHLGRSARRFHAHTLVIGKKQICQPRRHDAGSPRIRILVVQRNRRRLFLRFVGHRIDMLERGVFDNAQRLRLGIQILLVRVGIVLLHQLLEGIDRQYAALNDIDLIAGVASDRAFDEVVGNRRLLEH